MLRCIVRGSEVMKKDEVPSNKKPEEKKRTSTTQKTTLKTTLKMISRIISNPGITRKDMVRIKSKGGAAQ